MVKIMVLYSSILRPEATHAGVAELADARDLKSRGSDPVPVRPRSPAPYRGVEQLVARRAHNPEVAGSSPVPATRKRKWRYLISTSFFVVLYYILCNVLILLQYTVLL